MDATPQPTKSHRLEAVNQIFPNGVSETIAYLTDRAFNVDRNMDDIPDTLLIFREEMTRELDPHAGKSEQNLPPE